MKAERDILTHLLSQTGRMVKGQADHVVFKAQNEIKEHKNCRTLFWFTISHFKFEIFHVFLGIYTAIMECTEKSNS